MKIGSRNKSKNTFESIKGSIKKGVKPRLGVKGLKSASKKLSQTKATGLLGTDFTNPFESSKKTSVKKSKQAVKR